jgi:hypothetical protein
MKQNGLREMMDRAVGHLSNIADRERGGFENLFSLVSA